jgi:hypothetical protein
MRQVSYLPVTTQTACQTTPRSLILKILNKFMPKPRDTHSSNRPHTESTIHAAIV